MATQSATETGFILVFIGILMLAGGIYMLTSDDENIPEIPGIIMIIYGGIFLLGGIFVIFMRK